MASGGIRSPPEHPPIITHHLPITQTHYQGKTTTFSLTSRTVGFNPIEVSWARVNSPAAAAILRVSFESHLSIKTPGARTRFLCGYIPCPKSVTLYNLKGLWFRLTFHCVIAERGIEIIISGRTSKSCRDRGEKPKKALKSAFRVTNPLCFFLKVHHAF